MGEKLYYIRKEGDDDVEDYDIVTLYKAYPYLFSIKLHHGGYFTDKPGREYLDGKVTFVDCIDIDKFSVLEVSDMIEDLGYDGRSLIIFHFLKPNSCLDYGLQDLGSDQDVHNLTKYVWEHKEISVYCEHGKSNIYASMSPTVKKGVVIEEIEDDDFEEVPENSKMIVSKLSFRKQSHESVVVNESQQSVLVNESQPIVVVNESQPGDSQPSQTEAIDESENENGSDELSESGDDNSDDADYENEKESDDESDESDEEFIIDDENNIVDVEVDMRDFHCSVDKECEYMGNSSKTSETTNEETVDLEVLNNDEFSSGSDYGDGIDVLRRKKIRELRKQEQDGRDLTKTFFFLGQQFASAKEVKEYIKLHAVETRRSLVLVKKNDKARIRAACEGLMPSFEGGDFMGGKNMEAGQCSKEGGKDEVAGDVESQVEGDVASHVVSESGSKVGICPKRGKRPKREY